MNTPLQLLRRCIALVGVMPLMSCGEDGNMYDQPHHESLESSSFFQDGASARPLVEGTVAQSDPIENDGYATGWEQGIPLAHVPLPITTEFMQRGRERFDIFCAPCHGRDGYGQGMIVQRGFTAPPSLHVDRALLLPDGFYFGVITNGFGRMGSYAQQVPLEDRWAIIAYIRALQMSQRAHPNALPDQMRIDLEQRIP